MRMLRVIQLVVTIAAIIYVAVVQNANPVPVSLPGLLPLPLWLIIALTAVASFLSGWLPATIRAWRRGRDNARLERRIADLESHVPSYDRTRSAPVIPDRGPAQTEGDPSEPPDA